MRREAGEGVGKEMLVTHAVTPNAKSTGLIETAPHIDHCADTVLTA